MMGNHAPLVIAERFATLEALHPGRIDLGLGRAPGTDQKTARALRRDESALDGQAFVDQLEELRGFVTGALPEGSRFHGIRAIPGGADLMPPMILLGSSGFSAQVAAHLGQRFAFAHHFSSANTVPALTLYRDRFLPSADLAAPHAIVTVTVICADTEAEAQHLAGSLALAVVRLAQGRPAELATPEEATAHEWTGIERQQAQQFLAGQLIGTPATVVAGLRSLAARTGADELMLTGHIHDEVAHRDGFAKVAETIRAPGG
jgi:luciferase family oxidoreductase group 1